jgi:hypothetical protein
VAASQAGQEAVYLRALLRGFNFRQVGATEIWEDNASCIMMSKNPANQERTRHVDTRVHYLRELVRDGHVKLFYLSLKTGRSPTASHKIITPCGYQVARAA